VRAVNRASRRHGVERFGRGLETDQHLHRLGDEVRLIL